jgi:hypothetical protein
VRKFLYTLIILFFGISNLSADLNGEVTVGGNSPKIKSGDIVDIVLKIWPIENPSKAEFESLVGKNLFNSFYISEITQMAPSENNADVFEIHAKGIVVDDLKTLSFSYKGEVINFKPLDLKIEKIEEAPKDFYILNQSQDYDYQSIILYSLIIFSLLGIVVYFIKYKKKKVVKVNPRSLYAKKFAEAADRASFEWIYAQKEEWIKLLDIETQAHKEFLITINAHQFKKEWSKEDQFEVENSFEAIRGSFK